MIDKKNRTILMILAILTLIVTMIGATFAYFKAISKSEPQIITTSSLNINLALKGSMNIKNIKPTIWSNNINENEANKDIAIIPFEVTSDSKITAIYGVTMSTNIKLNTNLVGGKVSDIKYKLYKNGTYYSEGSFSENFKEKIINDGSITLKGNLDDKYKLYIYIEDSNNFPQNQLQDINFTINLMADANQTE